MSIFLGTLNLVGIAVSIYLLWGLKQMASNAADVLREVNETTQSNTEAINSSTELTGKVLELLQAASQGSNGELTLSQEQADSITGALQTVQDNNAQVVASNTQTIAAISAVLPAPAGDGTTGTGEGAEA